MCLFCTGTPGVCSVLVCCVFVLYWYVGCFVLTGWDEGCAVDRHLPSGHDDGGAAGRADPGKHRGGRIQQSMGAVGRVRSC